MLNLLFVSLMMFVCCCLPFRDVSYHFRLLIWVFSSFLGTFDLNSSKNNIIIFVYVIVTCFFAFDFFYTSYSTCIYSRATLSYHYINLNFKINETLKYIYIPKWNFKSSNHIPFCVKNCFMLHFFLTINQ